MDLRSGSAYPLVELLALQQRAEIVQHQRLRFGGLACVLHRDDRGFEIQQRVVQGRTCIIECLRFLDEVVHWVVLAVGNVCGLYELLVLSQEELRHARITLVSPFVKILTSSSMYSDSGEFPFRVASLLRIPYSLGSMMICLFSSLYIWLVHSSEILKALKGHWAPDRALSMSYTRKIGLEPFSWNP